MFKQINIFFLKTLTDKYKYSKIIFYCLRLYLDFTRESKSLKFGANFHYLIMLYLSLEIIIVSYWYSHKLHLFSSQNISIYIQYLQRLDPNLTFSFLSISCLLALKTPMHSLNLVSNISLTFLKTYYQKYIRFGMIISFKMAFF